MWRRWRQKQNSWASVNLKISKRYHSRPIGVKRNYDPRLLLTRCGPLAAGKRLAPAATSYLTIPGSSAPGLSRSRRDCPWGRSRWRAAWWRSGHWWARSDPARWRRHTKTRWTWRSSPENKIKNSERRHKDEIIFFKNTHTKQHSCDTLKLR